MVSACVFHSGVSLPWSDVGGRSAFFPSSLNFPFLIPLLFLFLYPFLSHGPFSLFSLLPSLPPLPPSLPPLPPPLPSLLPSLLPPPLPPPLPPSLLPFLLPSLPPPPLQFIRGLSLCCGQLAHLSRDEIQRIVEHYHTPDGRVRYKEFCDLMENSKKMKANSINML